MTRLKTKLSALLPFIGLLCAQAQRDMKTINDGWFFRKASTENWQPVNVPHTYNLDAYSQRNYYMGKAFYQKSFVLPEVPQGKRCFLKIDAASKAADLMLNGQKDRQPCRRVQCFYIRYHPLSPEEQHDRNHGRQQPERYYSHIGRLHILGWHIP